MDRRGIEATEVLAATCVWAVFYDGRPMNIRRRNILVDYPGPKYPKVTHMSAGSSFLLKRKLNKLYRTDKFQVYALTLTGGRLVQGDYPGDDVDFFGPDYRT